ncbi:DNA polymerase [Shewanella sp. A14]
MKDDFEESYLDAPEKPENNSTAEADDLESSYGIDDKSSSSRNRDNIKNNNMREVKSKKQISKERQIEIRKHLKQKRIPTALKPIISIDTEYEQDGEQNNVLSYQYVVSFEGRRCQGIFFTDSGHKKHRLSFETFLAKVIQAAIQEKVISKWPEHILLVAHYLKADLFTFSNAFKDIKTLVSSVRKTVASLRDGYAVDLGKEFKKRIDDNPFKLNDGSNNTYPILVTFYDSMLFAPAGFQSLKKIGELVGCPKKEIPPPYDISRMGEYLNKDRDGFTEYAINDAMIACLHIEQVIQYECIEGGNPHLSFTIGSLAVKAFKETLLVRYKEIFNIEEDVTLKDESFKEYFNSIFGKEKVVTERWIKKSGSTEFQPITDKHYALKSVPHLFETMAIECYHGGRNECYITGPTGIDTWYDFDAPSCYTVILNGLRSLDFDRIKISDNIEDFLGDVYGLLRVKFKFKDDTMYPSLPVRADPFGLVYPLEGICYCTAAEIEVAHYQGAQIEILQGFRIPWLDDERIFTPFMKLVRAKRQHYKTKQYANDFLEKFWKEKGNSCYGRLAMSLRPKRVFDIKSGNMKYLEQGELTNAFFAAYVSGTARALLSSLLLGVPKDKQVIALTTDGFTCNSSLEDIDKSSPVCNRFRSLFHMIDPNGGDILEEKHRMQQVIAMKTRGYTTAIRDDDPEWNSKFINARAGVQLPEEADEENPEVWVLNKFLDRTPDSTYINKSLTPSQAMFLFDRDMISIEKKQLLNYEPDFKRDLIPNGMVDVHGKSHLQCLSKPHRTVEDMKLKRSRFDAWRINNCLKTEEDWDNWEEYFKLSTSLQRIGKGNFMNIKKGENITNVFKRLFLRVWVQELCGVTIDGMKQNAFAKWMSELDEGIYPVNAAAISSAKKSEVFYGRFPVTHRVIKLLKHLVKKFPTFDYEKLFLPDDIEELRRLMQQ